MDDVPGMKEAAITSDDIFWMEKPPGKTYVQSFGVVCSIE